MKKQIEPSGIEGPVKVPASKSYMQRAIAAAMLSKGTTVIENPSFCRDAVAAMSVASTLGAEITETGSTIEITGGFPSIKPESRSVNIHESGLGIRLFTPVAALSSEEITIEAAGSLLKRPVDMLAAPIRALGADFSAKEGLPPVKVRGPLKGGSIDVDGSLSSQFITGLITALSSIPEESFITVKNAASKPYLAMTLQTLKSFGAEIEHQNYEEFRIKGKSGLKSCTYRVESDWSCAAAFLTAGAIGGSVTIDDLPSDSLQADRAILDALKEAGADIEIKGQSITVTRNRLDAFTFDATHCPDLFPPLVALAANCKGETVIYGAKRLTHKESNRALTLKNLFEKLGIDVKIEDNRIVVTGGDISGGEADSCNDHRIVMAAALAAINATSPVTITRSEAVEKSWPGFFTDFASIGGVINE